jgi:membrane-associated phospholipid phosphatase
MSTASHTGEGKFPDTDWADRYRGQNKLPPKEELFSLKKLKLDRPSKDTRVENVVLLMLMPLRTPKQLERIRRQAQGEKWVIQPVLDVLYLNYDRPANVEASRLRQVIQSNIWRAVFHFKCEFMRSRSWSETPNTLQPVFLKPNRLYPGHPSYPSGHATMAYTWAYLLGHYLSADHAIKKLELLGAAAEVALNREIAGVHFKSDSDEGMRLGEEIAKAIVQGGKLSQSDIATLMPGWV